MEPNQVNAQNTNGNAGVASSDVSAKPIDSTTHSGIMEQTASANTITPAKPKSHAMLLGVILLAMVAVGGIVFGAVTMAQKGSEAEQYQKQIATLRETINEQAENTESITVTTSEGEEVEIEKTVTNTEDYIYVGAWGMKISIPDNLKSVSYSFHQAAGSTVLYVSGASGGGQYFPQFADMLYNYSGMVAVARYPVGTVDPSTTVSIGSLAFSDDEFDYYCSTAQAVYSTDEDEKAWELESAQVIYDMLSNPDNYSAI